MSKYKYTYQVEFYSTDGIIKNKYVDARTRQEALEIAGTKDKIIQLITYAIQGQRFDPYFRIIPLYYEQHRTIENIAEEMGVDTSTVVRNKKRLCLLIYADIV